MILKHQNMEVHMNRATGKKRVKISTNYDRWVKSRSPTKFGVFILRRAKDIPDSVSKEKEQTELNHHTRIEKMPSSTQTSHQPHGESK
jgi:hypothetical protein